MDLDRAKSIVLEEGLGPDGIAVAARNGEDPGENRIRTLLEALRHIYEDTKENKTIEKQLAHSIFSIAFHTTTQIEGWIQKGHEYREELTETEMPLIEAACESILVGEWIEIFE